jgi:hypothetical protein
VSRYDGWLIRFIVMRGTPAALTIKAAAKSACIRPDSFAQALRDPKSLREDAKHLGIDMDYMRAIDDWVRQCEADEQVQESMVQSGASVTRIPSSEKYRGSSTRLGVTCPHPPNSRRDHLNIAINPIQHPEPQGEWHDGLNAAGKRER